MQINLKMYSETGNIEYKMNFDTVLAAVDYGDAYAFDFEVLCEYYNTETAQWETKSVWSK